MPTQYVVTAANNMYAIMSEHLGRPSNQAVLRATSIGCNTLRRLKKDRGFHQDMKQSFLWQHAGPRQMNEILLDLQHFEYFLELEAEVLEGAGLYQRLIEDLITEARNQMALIRMGSAIAITDPTDLIRTIAELEEICCKAANDLQERVIVEERRSRLNRLVRNVSIGVGGLAMAVANTGFLAATQGLTVFGSAASVTLGAGIVGAALNGRVTLFDDSAPHLE